MTSPVSVGYFIAVWGFIGDTLPLAQLSLTSLETGMGMIQNSHNRNSLGFARKILARIFHQNCIDMMYQILFGGEIGPEVTLVGTCFQFHLKSGADDDDDDDDYPNKCCGLITVQYLIVPRTT